MATIRARTRDELEAIAHAAQDVLRAVKPGGAFLPALRDALRPDLTVELAVLELERALGWPTGSTLE